MEAESSLLSCRHGAGAHSLHIKKWGGTDSHTPILCVHALTRVAGDFDALAKALAPRTVFAPDMAGRGQSPWLLDSSLYSYPHYIDDCVQAMDALKLEQVDWVGTSMGGLIGMMIAATHPARIRKLVLNDVGPFLPLTALKRIGDYLGVNPLFADMDQAFRYCRTVYAPFGIESDEGWKAITRRSVRQVKGGGYRMHYDPRIADNFMLVDKDVNLWPVYESIRCPTLVLRGENSDVLTAADAQAMTRRGPMAQLVTFEKCGHAPALETDEQIKTVTGFLNA